MKLLLINYEYPPIGGGAATATYHTARELLKQGHQITVLTANYQKLIGWADEEGIKVYRCRALRKFPSHSNLLEQFSFVVSAAVVLPKILKTYSIEGVIVYFSLPCGPLGLLSKIIRKTPYVISLHGGDVPDIESSVRWLHWLLTPIRRMVLRHAQSIIAVSDELRNTAEKADHFQVITIQNGVDTRCFHPIEHQNAIFHFLFVGRFHAQKNLFFLLEQLSQLKKTSNIPFKCHIVGDGSLKKALQEHTAKLYLESTVLWHGWLTKEKLRDFYQKSDCLLNLSLYEGMPIVLLEAMACGLPIVASRVIGNDAVVQHKKTGYLINLENPSQLQEILVSLLNNQELARQLGLAGRERVVREFSWEPVAKKYIQLFGEVK